MITTNLVVALMIVTNGLQSVKAMEVIQRTGPVFENRNSIARWADNYGPEEELFRRVSFTNFVYLSHLEHRVGIGPTSADFKNVKWIKYCDCPCHNGECVLHDDNNIYWMREL